MRPRLLVPLALAAGVAGTTACGRIGFAPSIGDDDDGLDDATPPADAFAAGCWPAWRSGAVRLTVPQPLAGLATASTESNPALSADGLTLYFDRGSGAMTEPWRASRAAPGDEWGAPELIAELNSGLDGRMAPLADGLSLIFNSSRPAGDQDDLYVATRATPGSPFDAPTQSGLAAVNTPDDEFDPELPGGDPTRLYLAPRNGGGQHIAIATRVSAADAFGPFTVVPGFEVQLGADPTLSPDERVIVFSTGPTTPEVDLYYRVRASRDDAFGAVVEVPDVNSGEYDANADLRDDGCELIFDSKRGGGGDSDLYVSTVVL